MAIKWGFMSHPMARNSLPGRESYLIVQNCPKKERKKEGKKERKNRKKERRKKKGRKKRDETV